MDDAGSYTCVAQNPAGVTSNSIYLDVYTPPKFDTELPQSMTVVVGEVSNFLMNLLSALLWFCSICKDTMSDLTGPGIETQTYRATSEIFNHYFSRPVEISSMENVQSNL